MDKNTWIGLGLIAAIVIGFTIFTKPTKEELEREQRYQDSIRSVQAAQVKEDVATNSQVKEQESSIADFFDVSTSSSNDSASVAVDSTEIKETLSEQIVSLENKKVRIDFTTKGGQIRNILLKEYKDYKGDSLYVMNSDANFFLSLMNKKGALLNTDKAIFTPIQNPKGSQTLVMRMNVSDNQYIDFIYALAPDDYRMKFDIAVVGMDNLLSVDGLENFTLKWQQNLRRQEKSEKNEQRYAKIQYKTLDGSFDGLSETNNDTKEVTSASKWVAFKDQYFAGVLIADESFKNLNLSSQILQSDKYLKSYAASIDFRPERKDDKTLTGSFSFFFGPLDYHLLKDYDDGKDSSAQLELDRLVPLGWAIFRIINKYFIVPLFSLLRSSGMQMGLIIFLLTLIVKIIISPLTFKSFMSSAKMRVLKPQVDVINEKYPGQEKAMERQKAVMALYNQAGVNPMSGCVPMLLQMPVLFALFQFFPSAIELRQQSFLWADDLSTYDAIIEWSGNIPLISSWLGNHISLFCVLMTATNIIYTKFNMDSSNTGQQQMPGMKWMMILMPLIFFFVLNSYPAGLNYYYFISLLITVLITVAFRYFVDEKKVLAKLEENKKKPKKKGFMARLQEQAEQAQRMQQQQANARSKQNRKRK
jgi:YidC/Oxa1 family membrane protein insertase